jgi:signal transduction histidine kinase
VAWSSVPMVLLVDKHPPGDLRRTLRDPLGPDKPLTILERPVPAQTLVEVVQTTIELRQQQAEVRTLLTQLTLQNGRLSREVAAHQATVQALRQSEAHLQTLNATLEQRVTERTAALEERNTELDQFAYIASHDLKAPLRAIRQLTTWITEDAAAVLPAASQTHLVKLRGRVQRMEQMIEDLLAYSRAGRQRYAPELVELVPLVRAISEFLAPPPDFTIITEPMPALLTERVPLETVLRNLIGNAIKHHDRPQVGQVTVAVVDQGAFAEFSVRDNGPGIAPQFHNRIFQVFQTLQPREQVEGSGMGLAIVKKAVESRAGQITVESQLGQGAIFRFTWPKHPLLPQ